MPLGQIRFITGVAVMRSGVCLMARILGNLGVPITQASLLTLTYAVTDLVTLVTGTPVALTIAGVIYNSLIQNDPRWTPDSAAFPGPDGQWGYNFLTTLPAGLFVTTNRQHVDVVATPVTGEAFRVPFEFTCLAGYA